MEPYVLHNHPECGAMLMLVTWLFDPWQVTSPCWGMPESAVGLAVQLAGYAVQGLSASLFSHEPAEIRR